MCLSRFYSVFDWVIMPEKQRQGGARGGGSVGEIFFTSISAPPADHHRTPTYALSNLVYVTSCVTFLEKLLGFGTL